MHRPVSTFLAHPISIAFSTNEWKYKCYYFSDSASLYLRTNSYVDQAAEFGLRCIPVLGGMFGVPIATPSDGSQVTLLDRPLDCPICAKNNNTKAGTRGVWAVRSRLLTRSGQNLMGVLFGKSSTGVYAADAVNQSKDGYIR